MEKRTETTEIIRNEKGEIVREIKTIIIEREVQQPVYIQPYIYPCEPQPYTYPHFSPYISWWLDQVTCDVLNDHTADVKENNIK